MAKKLVIVESPAKAKAINKYLGRTYKVQASMGHIRDLPRSRLGVDLEAQFEPTYVISKDKKKIVTELKKTAKNMEHVFLAADPDREGEAICWHLKWILENTRGFKGNIKRVAFNEITPQAVKDAFLHPREVDLNLVNAQQARRILDRIVGYKLSPLLWKKVARGLSAGRVQSVAVKLIIDREREIRNFVPKEYWSLEAEFAPLREEIKEAIFKAKLERIDGHKISLDEKNDVDTIVADLEGAEYIVSKIDEKKKSRRPQPPFITSKLQQEAYTKLRFPAQKTMRVAQSLYEGVDIGEEGTVGLITYMRTDSVSISKSAMAEVRSYIQDTYGQEYLSPKPHMYKSRKRAQEAHEAIRPTATERTPESLKNFLNDDEYKLYDLIWKRFVSSQMSDAQDAVRSVDIMAKEKYLFRTSSTTNIFPGFTKVYQESEKDDEQTDEKADEKKDEKQYEVPHLVVDDQLRLLELLPNQHFTKPPPRFNDASLVRTLEELGIGRPSTYAPTIQTIIGRGYVERRSSALHPKEIAEIVTDLLVKHFEYLLDVKFTAHMEDDLDEVEDGKKEWIQVLAEFYKHFAKLLTHAQEQMKNVKKTAIPTEHICDICGKQMVKRWGRFGEFLACSAFPDCKYTKSIPTGYRCPQEDCDGELVRRQSRQKRMFFGCSNYPKCTYTSNKPPKQEEGKEPINE